MIDAEPGDHTTTNPLENGAVDEVEDLGVLDANACQIGDVEEAAIVDARGPGTPVGEAKVLGFEDPVRRCRIGIPLYRGRVRGQRKQVFEVADHRRALAVGDV